MYRACIDLPKYTYVPAEETEVGPRPRSTFNAGVRQETSHFASATDKSQVAITELLNALQST